MIDYTEDWIFSILFRTQGSVIQRAALYAVPSAVLTFFLASLRIWSPDYHQKAGLDEVSSSVLWSASTGVLVLLLGFRTNRAMARFWEGTGLLHQMRGEWFDSISCCVTFSRSASLQRPDEVTDFRHTLIRLMSLCHGCALEEIGLSGEELETIDSFGLDNTTLQHLKDCKLIHHFNTVEVLLHLIQTLITKSHEDGVLKIPPPILSRVYQTLSRGFVNLLNAKKIADTRFPFPYAQTISMLLFLNMFLTPAMVSCMVESRWWAPVFTLVPLLGLFCLNFIGVELENPFGRDANDLPLDHFQTEMNKCLLMLLQDSADLVPGVSRARCVKSYVSLKGLLRPSHLTKEEHQPRSSVHIVRRLSHFDEWVDMNEDNEPEKIQQVAGEETWSLKTKETEPVYASDRSSRDTAARSSARTSLEPVALSAADRQASRETVARSTARTSLEPMAFSAADEIILTPENDMRDLMEYASALQKLKSLVQTELVAEFSSVTAKIKAFSEAIPNIPDSVHTATTPSMWQQALARDLDNRELTDGLSQLIPPKDGPRGIQKGGLRTLSLQVTPPRRPKAKDEA